MKKLLISAIAFGVLATVVSCEKEKIITYTGPAVVEFGPSARTVYTPTFPYPDSSKIQLVSKQLTTDSKVTYKVDAASTAASPANFEITGTLGESVIPANSSFAFVKHTLYPAPSTGTAKKLVLTLTGGDLPLSVNYVTHTLTINPTPVIFTPNAKTITFNGGTAAIRDTVRVRLNATAARFNQPMTLNYTARAASTAVEGTDYAFVSTKGVATVPANGSDALVILDINPAAAGKTLILDVTLVPGISLVTASRIITYTFKP